MRVSQEDSTVKKTHAAMKTVCRRCGGDVSGCGAGYHMVPRAASRASAEARLVLPPNITSPTCGRHSRVDVRLYGVQAAAGSLHESYLDLLRKPARQLHAGLLDP